MAVNYTTDFFGYIEPDASSPFYVYLLLRPNGCPFYVGKGLGDRVNNHEKEARRKRICRCRKCKVIRAIWASGGTVGKQIIFSTRDEQEAYRIEALTIQRFRRQLVNILDYDPNLLNPPRRQKRASKEERDEQRKARLARLIDSRIRQERYARMLGTTEERARLIAEIEALEDEYWGSRQHTFFDTL